MALNTGPHNPPPMGGGPVEQRTGTDTVETATSESIRRLDCLFDRLVKDSMRLQVVCDSHYGVEPTAKETSEPVENQAGNVFRLRTSITRLEEIEARIEVLAGRLEGI